MLKPNYGLRTRALPTRNAQSVYTIDHAQQYGTGNSNAAAIHCNVQRFSGWLENYALHMLENSVHTRHSNLNIKKLRVASTVHIHLTHSRLKREF